MKLKLIVTFFLASFLFILTSCRDSKKTKNDSNEKISQNLKLEFSEDFTVTLKAKVEIKDEFQIFYIQDPSEVYNDRQFVSVEVNGSDEIQNIEIRFPNNVYPFNFRLDLGTNRQQESIEIESLTLNFKSGSYTIKGQDLLGYFFINEGIEVNADSSIFNLKTFKNGTVEVYDPLMIGRPELNDIIYTKL